MTSQKNPKALRSALAQTVAQFFTGQAGAPDRLPQMPVHPAKLRHRLEVDLGGHGLLTDVRTLALGFRKVGQPNIEYTITASGDADIYGCDELTGGGVLAVDRADIAFTFCGGGKPPRTKVAALTEPNRLAFPRFMTAEQAIAEDVLIRNGLLDADPSKGQSGPFDVLDSMTAPECAASIERELGAGWFNAFLDAGILAGGPQATRYRCAGCNMNVQLDIDPTRADAPTMTCACGTRVLGADDLRTVRFHPSRFAEWLATQYGSQNASRQPWQAGAWDLGDIVGAGRQPGVAVMFLHGASSPGRLAAMSQRIASSASRPKGLLVCLTSRYVGLALPLGWKVATAAGLIGLVEGSLVADPAAPHRMLSGKPAKATKADRKEAEKRLLAAFEEIRDEVANAHAAETRIRELHPDAWPWKVGTIAKKLRKQFPQTTTR